MSRRRSAIEQAQRKAVPKCPKCRSRNRRVAEYPLERVLLLICNKCQFPERKPMVAKR